MIPIAGYGVVLRGYRESDADDLAAGCADPLTQRFQPRMPRPYTRADALWWIAQGAPAAWAAGGAAYAIADPVTDRLLGGAGVDSVLPERAQGEMGYWVAPWARRRGVATAAARTLAGWAFARGFGRLELLTDLANALSMRVALATGFQPEGVRRGADYGRDGARTDRVVWARLATDPPGPTARALPDLPAHGLADGSVLLRPLGPDDGEFLYALQTRPDVVGTSVPPIAPDRVEVALRCARAQGRWLLGERADLVIAHAATGAATGIIGLYCDGAHPHEATIGYAMLPAWRGRGFPTRAVRLLAAWAFAEAGIGRLMAGVAPGNVASARVLEKAGFRREGWLRGRRPGLSGTRVDDVAYGLLAEDLAFAQAASDRTP
ncbi:GNAT family protein [Actinomycetes bacterium KLBMP 9797]